MSSDATTKPPQNRLLLEPYPIAWVELQTYPPGVEHQYKFGGYYISEIRTQRASKMFNGNIKIKIGLKTKYKVHDVIEKKDEYRTIQEIFPLRTIVEIYVGKGGKTNDDSYFLIQTAYVHSLGVSINYNGEAELNISFKPLDSILSDHKIFVSAQNVSTMIQGAIDTKNNFTEYKSYEKTGTYFKHGNGTNIKNLISNLKRNTMISKSSLDDKNLKVVIFGKKYTLVDFNDAELTELLHPVVFDATKCAIFKTSLKDISYLESMIKIAMKPREDLGRDVDYKTAFSSLPIPFITNIYYEPLIKFGKGSGEFNSLIYGTGASLTEHSTSIDINSIIVASVPYNFWFKKEGKTIRWRTPEELDTDGIPYYYIEGTCQYSIDFSSEEIYTLLTQAINPQEVAGASKSASHQDTQEIFGNKTYVYENSTTNLKDAYKRILTILYPDLSNFQQTKIGTGSLLIPYSPVRVNYPIFFKGIDGDMIAGRVTGVVDDINAEGMATTTIDFDMVALEEVFSYNYNEGEITTANETSTQQADSTTVTTPLPKKASVKKPKYFKRYKKTFKAENSKVPTSASQVIQPTEEIPNPTGRISFKDLPPLLN